MPDFTASDDTRLSYEEWGDPTAPAVLLLHGFTASGRMWQPQVGPLSDDYRVIVPDLRGHGRSQSPAEMDRYGIERYARDLVELLDDLEVTVCALAGCSFGGMIALQFATMFPPRVAALVISDASPAYESPRYDERFRTREAGMRDMEEVVRKFGTATLGKRMAADVADAFLADGIRERFARLDADGYLGASLTRRTRPDLTPVLREKLTMPVMLCDGDEDPVFSALDVVADELPGARVVVFRGAGHGLPAQRPEQFTDVLFDFLRDVEDGKDIAGRRTV